MKTCTMCGESGKEMRTRSRCLECYKLQKALYQKEWYKNPENRRAQLERVKAYAARDGNCTEFYLACRLKKYGLSRAAYDAMVADAAGHCQLCGKGDTLLHIDHCHVSGRVRGLLCPACNTGLGKLRADEGGLDAALKYINSGLDKRDRRG